MVFLPTAYRLLMLVGFDIRRANAFGVGTYIQSLLRALAPRGPEHEYLFVGSSTHQSVLGDLPENFRLVEFEKAHATFDDHLRLQFLLRPLGPEVFHIPHRAVPYFMPCPYVVTVHDLDKLVFQEALGSKLRAEV